MVINYNISQAQATVQNHEDINPTTERANKNGNIAIIFNQKKILLPKKEIVKNKKSQKQREERKDIFGIDHLAEQSKVLSQKIIGQMWYRKLKPFERAKKIIEDLQTIQYERDKTEYGEYMRHFIDVLRQQIADCEDIAGLGYILAKHSHLDPYLIKLPGKPSHVVLALPAYLFWLKEGDAYIKTKKGIYILIELTHGKRRAWVLEKNHSKTGRIIWGSYPGQKCKSENELNKKVKELTIEKYTTKEKEEEETSLPKSSSITNN